MNVPACAIHEIQIMRYLDKPNTSLDETATEQTTLTEFAAVLVSHISRFFSDLERTIELGAAEPEAFINRCVVIEQARFFGWLRAFLKD